MACGTAGRLSANPFLGSADNPPPAPVRSSAAPSVLRDAQLDIRARIGSIMKEAKERRAPADYLWLFAISFIYGILHGAGPGHRKTVVFSLFLSRRSSWPEPLAAGFFTAGVHAGTSIVLVGLFSLLTNGMPVLARTDITGLYMEGVTFSLLMVLALVFITMKTVELAGSPKAGVRKPRSVYGMLAVTSLIPCPGATMILLFAVFLDMALAGILSVLCMSIGMGIVISAAGYLAYAGREGLFLSLKNHEKVIKVFSSALEITAYAVIFLFSAYMAWPFLASLASSAAH